MTQRDKTADKPMPLEGIRIVEFGVFHAGPGATAILGDLGAEVIKIESWTGDPERTWTRIGKVDMALLDGESIFFQISNRNKKGIYLDLEKEKGREILLRLVKEADVFLTNLRKSTKARLGLDYAALSRVNPRLIHANVSGFGPEGPRSDNGAFDPLGLARSGMMFATGSSEPLLIHGGVLDQATAIAASHAILTALLVRERQGIGQEVHVSLYGTGNWLMYCNLMLANLLSIAPEDIAGSRSDHSPLRNCFRCQDGKWLIGTHHPEEKYWPAFCEVTGRTDLFGDSRFRDDESRQAHCAELVVIFDQVFATRPRDEWLERLLERGLMFAPVQHVQEVQADPQALQNDYIVDFDHPRLGLIKIPGYPIQFSANRAGTRSLAPTLGEHTDLILRQSGYTEQQIEDLKKEGVIK